jgi:hypothetical protein
MVLTEFNNPASNRVTAESCNRKATASGVKTPCEIGKKFFRRAFDKNIDLAGASKPFTRVETHQDGLASSQNASRV